MTLRQQIEELKRLMALSMSTSAHESAARVAAWQSAPALIEALEAQHEALKLVSVGLKNKSIKSKPIISFRADATSADMQSLDEILDAALALLDREG